MKSIEISGKTVEDAVKAGLKELGCDPSDVAIDVLQSGSPGLFGMFGKLAKVRLTVKEEDPELDFGLSDIDLSLNPVKEGKSASKSKPERREVEKKAEEKPVAVSKPSEETIAPAAEKEKLAEKVEDRQPVRSEPPRKVRKPENKSETFERSAPAPKAEEPFEPSDLETLSEAGKLAYDFLQNVTSKMGVTVGIRVAEEEGHLSVSMMGDTLGILIGRRGDTLDALQYLTSLQVNKHRDNYLRVSLDVENYRQKREESLTKLAMRMAARARKSGRKVTLEPMNPYERRVLHSALQNNPYVTTHSEGEEPYRRVVITLRQDAE